MDMEANSSDQFTRSIPKYSSTCRHPRWRNTGKTIQPNMICGVCKSNEWGYLIVKCTECSNAAHRYCLYEVSFDPNFKWLCEECVGHINRMEKLDSYGMVPEIKREVEMTDNPPFQLHVKEEAVQMEDFPPF
ncbi:unnamed protein product, partial [Cuscuta epithymum]